MPFDMSKTVKAQKRPSEYDDNERRKIPKADEITVEEIVPKAQVRSNHAPVKVCIYKYP